MSGATGPYRVTSLLTLMRLFVGLLAIAGLFGVVASVATVALLATTNAMLTGAGLNAGTLPSVWSVLAAIQGRLLPLAVGPLRHQRPLRRPLAARATRTPLYNGARDKFSPDRAHALRDQI